MHIQVGTQVLSIFQPSFFEATRRTAAWHGAMDHGLNLSGWDATAFKSCDCLCCRRHEGPVATRLFL